MSLWPTERFTGSREVLLGPGRVWDLGNDRAHADFPAWCAAHPGARCRVHVSSALVTELPVDAALPLDDDAALVEWARVQVRGLAADDAAAEPDCAAWQAGDLRGVSVLHGMSLATLQAQAASARVAIHAVRPWWSHVLARALRCCAPLRVGNPVLVVAEGARIAAVEMSNGRVAGVQTTYLDAADARALADWARTRGAAVTVAAGFGVAAHPADRASSVQILPGLHADGPGITWREALR